MARSSFSFGPQAAIASPYIATACEYCDFLKHVFPSSFNRFAFVMGGDDFLAEIALAPLEETFLFLRV